MFQLTTRQLIALVMVAIVIGLAVWRLMNSTRTWWTIVVAVLVIIAVGLLVYYMMSGKQQDEE